MSGGPTITPGGVDTTMTQKQTDRLKKATKRVLKKLPPEMPETLEAWRQSSALKKWERGMKSFKGRV